jgi:integrase
LFPGLPDERRLYQRFKAAVRRSGIDPATSPHDLRRTWVARLAEARVPLSAVLELGGWASLGVLVRHYFADVHDDAARAFLEEV